MVQVVGALSGEPVEAIPTLQVRGHAPVEPPGGRRDDEIGYPLLFDGGAGMETVLGLGRGGLAPGLVERAVTEARQSDLFTGTDPEHWSPLAGYPDLAALGALGARVELARRAGPDAASFRETGPAVRVDEGTNNGWFTYRVSQGRDERAFSAQVALSPDAFVAVVPAHVDEVFVIPENRDLVREPVGFGPSLSDDTEWGVLWRTYAGEGTDVVDGVLRTARERGVFGRVRLAARRGAAILVGRIVMIASHGALKHRSDPTRRDRLAEYSAADRETVDTCPDVSYARSYDDAVVAVHGTMSCAVPIAATLRELLPRLATVLRFEHDTWQPLVSNADELADALVRRVRPRRVTLVAHSRGGLVARHAMHLLREQGVETTVISLGTPYLGTPLIGTAEAGRRGLQAVLGALRWAGGPFVDTATRLASLALPRVLPPGIAAMQEGSDYLGLARTALGSSGVTAVGGSTAEGADSWSFVDESLRQLFLQQPNDRVVPQASALAVGTPYRIECDHFSYLLDPDVRDLLKRYATERLTW
ncbi:triacylglycerol lipase [Cellulosimicrobium sp. CUA-896]|uniref:esterase/lipase family protein n=1 Tax=Cellulosimicrobium sp. CUA-896 TaxID=1517881 RepID=UPI00095F3E63|nr:hypothetical protein [Cellulosimicrobium sp. CUA-896]OLT55210.1 hypothetical protein BJF88_07165 [Cellulosimicrobium sp. CUA-896]